MSTKTPKAAIGISLPTSRVPGPTEAARATHGQVQNESRTSNDTDESEVGEGSVPPTTTSSYEGNVKKALEESGEKKRKPGRPKGSRNKPKPPSEKPVPVVGGGSNVVDMPLRRVTKERLSHTIRFEPEVKRELARASARLKELGFEPWSQDWIVNEATRRLIPELLKMIEQTEQSEAANQ